MKRFTSLLLLLLLLASGQASAQTLQETKESINKVKLNVDEYVYADCTSSSEQKARELAETTLEQEVNKWIAAYNANAQQPIGASNTRPLWAIVTMPRGTNMFRAFAYVSKADLKAGRSTATEVASEASGEKDEVEEDQSQQMARLPEMPDYMRRLLSITSYEEASKTLLEMKSNGKIKECERYGKLSDPTLYYLAVYNRQGKMVAYLSRGAQRVNLATGEPDDVANYSGCGALGIR